MISGINRMYLLCLQKNLTRISNNIIWNHRKRIYILAEVKYPTNTNMVERLSGKPDTYYPWMRMPQMIHMDFEFNFAPIIFAPLVTTPRIL